MNEHELTVEQAEIYNAVPVGKKNAISLKALEEKTGYRGRTIRRVFEQLSYMDYIVCNLRSGYFRPATLGEYDAYIKIINSYRKKLAKREHHLIKTRINVYGDEGIYEGTGRKRRERALQKAREV